LNHPQRKNKKEHGRHGKNPSKLKKPNNKKSGETLLLVEVEGWVAFPI